MSDDLTAAAGLIVGSPFLLGQALVTDIIGDIFGAAPLPDARPMPFSSAGCQAIADDEWNITSDLGRIKPASVGPGGAVAHAEYVEAFARLDALSELGRDCLGADAVRRIRAEIARGLNAGVYVADDGGFFCVQRERPTVGTVRAWLEAYATQIGQRCNQDHQAALVDAVAQARAPLNQPMPRRSSWLGFTVLAVGLGLVLWGLR